MLFVSHWQQQTHTEKFDVLVNVHGGGFTGQAGAIRHGIARALLQADAEYRPVLKKAGYLTRDPRMKERKKSRSQSRSSRTTVQQSDNYKETTKKIQTQEILIFPGFFLCPKI